MSLEGFVLSAQILDEPEIASSVPYGRRVGVCCGHMWLGQRPCPKPLHVAVPCAPPAIPKTPSPQPSRLEVMGVKLKIPTLQSYGVSSPGNQLPSLGAFPKYPH